MHAWTSLRSTAQYRCAAELLLEHQCRLLLLLLLLAGLQGCCYDEHEAAGAPCSASQCWPGHQLVSVHHAPSHHMPYLLALLLHGELAH
jgi:hypothetical protein